MFRFVCLVLMHKLQIEQIYTGCLSQGSYYLICGDDAIIIDPIREPDPYLERLQRDKVNLKYIFETHFHADFVSGHLELSQITGAPIVFGPNAHTDFESIIAKDEQVFSFGNCKIKLLHTPGHTLESSVLLLLDETGKEKALFTGDTLFIGDVGRPDLAQDSALLTKEELAGMLFDSLRNKVMSLPESTIIYPAHGAGSACGKNISRETVSTLGEQLRSNYALRQNMTRDEFIAEVLNGLSLPRGYFALNVALNKHGYQNLNTVIDSSLKALSVEQFERSILESNALILDTRRANEFYSGFVPGSLNIGLSGEFAPWAGAIIVDIKQAIILISKPGTEREAIIRLSRVGFDNVLGYLDGGFDAWKNAGKPIEHAQRITATQLEKDFNLEEFSIIDIRSHFEFEKGHLKDSINYPLDEINIWSEEFDTSKDLIIICASGYRSMIASSILKAKGIHRFYEVEGGFNAIKGTSLGQSTVETVIGA